MPDNAVDIKRLRHSLADPEKIRKPAFPLLQDLSVLASSPELDSQAQDMILRALEHRGAFGTERSILDALVRHVGLFPYLEPETLPLADRIAYEFHRPLLMGEDIVFHRPQAAVYLTLRLLVERKASSGRCSTGFSILSIWTIAHS